MRMRLSTSCALLTGSLVAGSLLAGCGATVPTTPTSDLATAPDTSSALPVQIGQHQVSFNPGIQTLTIDLEQLTGSITPKHRATTFNGDLFYLNINQFAGGFPVELKGLSIDGDQHLVVDYEVAHPFPAPADLSLPANGFSNRADLGISGRVLFLLGVDSTTLDPDNTSANYIGDFVFDFGGDIQRLQTKTLLNPAGYYDPAGMVEPANRPAGDATAFPFQQLIDEMATDGVDVVGSRVGISNGANSRGNYDPDAGGWQNSNIGANRNGWTGYGVLHQGQASRQQAIFDIDGVGGSISLDFAVIATYTDPRQGDNAAELRSNRIPKSNNPATFAYYMPHGAVDIERITPQFPGPFALTSGTPLLTNVEIIDQDSMALVDTDFPGQGGIRLDEVPTASGIEEARATSTELGIANEPGLNQLGLGSGEDPIDFLFSLDNTANSDGGIDAGAYVAFKVVDLQRQADEGLTLNNNNPPTPVAAGQEQTPIVYQVVFAEIM